MKRVLLLLVLGLLLMPLSLHAQENDSPRYRLRVPTDEALMNQVIEIGKGGEYLTERDAENFAANLSRILFTLHPALHEVSFELLLEAYKAIGIGHSQFNIFWRDEWVERLILTWLSDHQTDLSRVKHLRFADFRIDVKAVDFSGDGIPEYVLDVQKGKVTNRKFPHYRAEYVAYLVLAPHESGYRRIETPLRWNGYSWDNEGGQLQVAVRDLNADGLLEWLVMDGGYTGGGPGMGYANNGRLFVLGWREGQLIDLALPHTATYDFESVTRFEEDAGIGHGPIPRDVTWEFENVDGDTAVEILQRQHFIDNWYCEARVTKIIDWNTSEDRYQMVDEYRDYPDETRNCAHRQAEEAMWARDYERALEYFEHGMTLQPYSGDDRPSFYYDGSSDDEEIARRNNIDAYRTARMALAYRLTGKNEQADALLSSLDSAVIESESIRWFINSLKSNERDPLRICLKVYENFTLRYPREVLGVSRDMEHPWAPGYDPAKAGCDAPRMIEQSINGLKADQSPLLQLRTLGVPIRDTIQADLNGDGRFEFLIWSEIPMPPFFFTPVHDIYVVSRPYLDPYDQTEGIHLWPLSADAGLGIIYWRDQSYCLIGLDGAPWTYLYDRNVGCGGGYTQCEEGLLTEMKIWRLEDSALGQIFDDEICLIDLSRLFTDNSRILNGGRIKYEDGESFDLRFTWNEITGKFEREMAARPQPTPTPQLAYDSVDSAVKAGDYTAALTLIDNRFAQSADLRENPEAFSREKYFRARILEILNRPDEALAEYVAIYEAAPESAWGRLAALHLEVVE